MGTRVLNYQPSRQIIQIEIILQSCCTTILKLKKCYINMQKAVNSIHHQPLLLYFASALFLD